MTTRVKFDLEQPGTKTTISVHENQGFHSKMFCSDANEAKDSAESREFKFVHHIHATDSQLGGDRDWLWSLMLRNCFLIKK